jgi:hypothetical protein
MEIPSLSSAHDAESLIKLHERLLFLRAYPENAKVLKRIEQSLKKIKTLITELSDSDVDLSPLDDPEVSGIAGTSVTSNFSYALVRWLVNEYPNQLSIDWDWFENEEQFGATMPRFIPLLDEDASVEAHVPYREWLAAAKGRKNEVAWIVSQFESLEFSDKRKAELYDALKLHVTWQFGIRSSRTGMRLPSGRIFFHDQPFIQRRDVSLLKELNSPAIPLQRLSRSEGEKILDLARETSAVRYRELHGFTNGDARRAVKAELGRGTHAYVFGVPPENRLPLRAYHAAIVFKNGVPVAYFEGLSIFERMESGFNLYYTFRDGETAWLYAQILRLMKQMLGVTVFSIDPYQVGHENEEGIESGAFWFYRKLGFRPVRPDLMKLTLAEERKITSDSRHRTSAATLRKLAAGHMLFDSRTSNLHAREWDRFQVRNIGLAVQRRMSRDFRSNPKAIRDASTDIVCRVLRVMKPQDEVAGKLFSDLALVMATNKNFGKWTRQEKELAARILESKCGRDEAVYLKEMQKHASLRALFIQLGSGTKTK